MPITAPKGPSLGEELAVRNAVTEADADLQAFGASDAVDCAGWRSVVVYPVFSAGTAPTVKIRPVYRVGSRWVLGTESAALSEKGAAVFDVMGRKTYFSVGALTGSPTNVSVYAAGWEPFGYDGPRRG